ncbi:hypothetical protein [Allorhizocola rhizosphaerae]|uniref:hypothetical protein n=1 Tax=Allorhizocola rhizosphaerae TaxID=1872709 RepID=UPI001FE8F0C7|nr:hypothetical protein [Allorhizocola rhizosphaerae]
MIRIEAHCWLDWWANQVTLFASAEAAVTFAISATGWTATGRLTNDEDREGFAFLCDLDAVFSLRFDDDTTITVNVESLTNHGQFTLTEYT